MRSHWTCTNNAGYKNLYDRTGYDLPFVAFTFSLLLLDTTTAKKRHKKNPYQAVEVFYKLRMIRLTDTDTFSDAIAFTFLPPVTYP